MVCCPGNIICTALVDHDANIRCDKCVAPVCSECPNNIFQKKPEMPAVALTNDMMIYDAPE